MRIGRGQLCGLQGAVLVFIFAQCANADLLKFDITGTYDTPNGAYPLAAPPFEITFDLPSDPPNTVSGFDLVELYTAAVYSNDGISTPPLTNTYLLFSAGSNGGGLYIFLPVSAQLPYGLAVDFEFGSIPQIYSNTAAAPHFSPGTIDLDLARDRYADQGAGYPMSSISNAVLTITPTSVPEPSSLLPLSAGIVFVVWRIRQGLSLYSRRLHSSSR